MSLNVLHVLASDSSSNSIFHENALPVYMWLINAQENSLNNLYLEFKM